MTAGTTRDRPLILVVDSADDVREMYCTYLTYDGYDCIAAVDGEEALRLARERRPDLVLLEAALPNVDGWEVARTLKSDPALRAMCVVMLTSEVFEQHRALAARAGVDRFVAKPALPDDLAALVRQLLAERAAGDAG